MSKGKSKWLLVEDNPIPEDADYTTILLKDWYSKITIMAEADGYLMVVRPKCTPYVIQKKWIGTRRIDHWKFK